MFRAPRNDCAARFLIPARDLFDLHHFVYTVLLKTYVIKPPRELFPRGRTPNPRAESPNGWGKPRLGRPLRPLGAWRHMTSSPKVGGIEWYCIC